MAAVQEGGCACEAVRYRVHGEPAVGMVCHCKFCQRRLASAFAIIAYFDAPKVESLQGQLTTCEYRSDDTGRWLRTEFCSRCGTTICHRAEARPGFIGIAAGTFDEPDWFKIERHIWTRSKLPWVAIPEGVSIFPEAFRQ